MPKVTAALLSGPMYDPLYGPFEAFARAAGIELDIAFRGDHPALNAHLTGAASPPYDLLSTHSKYAPSQLRFLAPLDDLVPPGDLADFAPTALDHARAGGQLWGLPRNIDVRLLHYRTDLIPHPPATWDDLLTVARRIKRDQDLHAFAFPGRDSGLFGTFYELAEMAGAHLFPAGGRPDIENEGGRWAITLLRTFLAEGLAPPELPTFHYDEAHRCFREGRAAMVGDWPAYYALHSDPAQSTIADRFAVCPYPAGPAGVSLAYGGSHTFALTRRGSDNPSALACLNFLTSPQSQSLEAGHGSVPVRRSVMRGVQRHASPRDLARWQALENVIESHMLIPPKLECYPRIEEVIWTTVQSAIMGTMEPDQALQTITRGIEHIIASNHGR